MDIQNRRVAVISSTCPPFISGGISSAHYNLYKALKSKGVNAKIFTFTDHKKPEQEENDIVRHGTPSILLTIRQFVEKAYLRFIRKRESFHYAYQFPYILESMIGAFRIGKSLRSFKPDVIILPDNGAPGFFIRVPNGCRVIFISHHNPIRFTDEPLFGLFSGTDAGLALGIEKRTLRKVDKVICPSHYMKEVFNKTHKFRGPISVIPDIVDDEFITSIPACDLRKELSLPEDAPIVYIPSGGSPFKGARFVFEIIRRLASKRPEIGFYLSGGIQDAILQRELNFLPANVKVYNPGYLTYADNIATVKGCSFCVSPTLIESFGMALLEANYCALPVVAFDVGGNRDIITSGKNGYLAPFLDVEKLVSYAETLLTDEILLKEMRDMTSHVARDKFRSEDIADQYLHYIFSD